MISLVVLSFKRLFIIAVISDTPKPMYVGDIQTDVVPRHLPACQSSLQEMVSKPLCCYKSLVISFRPKEWS